MSIDFRGLGNGNTPDTVLAPREIFGILPSKDRRYQYLRDVQAEVLNKWFDRRDKKDTVLKMNTGSGKTVVGLLIMRSCLNEGIGPAVYVSPDQHLVKQVLEEAAHLGLEVTEDPESLRFKRGQAILVVNIYKLINGKSVFGVSGEGAQIDIGSIIVDDVHACLATTEQQFTVTLGPSGDSYNQLLGLFKEDLRKQSALTLIDIEDGEPNKNMLVPYWAWQNKISEVIKILHGIKDEDSIKFNWPLVRENLSLARCVFGANKAEITLRCVPIGVIPSFINARRRIFMSATLLDDSVLVSHFDVEMECLSRLVTPTTANDIGDRMILVPQEFNPNLKSDELKTFFKELSIRYNVVVIVPSYNRAKYWEDVADEILTKDNIYDGVQRLKDGHVGLVILVNRYDGIDLPDNACRILVIDGLPDVRRRIDKIEHSILAGSDYSHTQLIQRIEQGMGRGIRSSDDSCVVFLMGARLTDHLYTQGAWEKFTPATKAQISLSDRLSEQLRGAGLNKIGEVIELSLQRDAEWVKASKGAVVHLKYEPTGRVNPIVVRQRQAFNAASRGDYPSAAAELQKAVDDTPDLKVKGWLMQQLAEYTNFIDPVQSQVILGAAVRSNSRITHPIVGITYTRLGAITPNQANTCASYISRSGDANRYILEINALIDDLIFQPDTSEQFEEAFKNLAFNLGFVGQRPGAEYKKGPDNLWRIGHMQFLVVECKNGATRGSIRKHYCDQLSGSMHWFEQEYGTDCSAIPIIIHPVNLFTRECSPHPNTRVITLEKLEELRSALVSFSTTISSQDNFGNTNNIAEALRYFSFTPNAFTGKYTVEYRIEN